MCLSRSYGTGVVVRRRVTADARLPVAILHPVPPSSSPPPPSIAKIVVLCATLLFTTVGFSPTFAADSADDTERTGYSGKVDRVRETTFGDRPTTANVRDVVVLSPEVRSQTTPESPVDRRSDGSNKSPETPTSMTTHSQRGTAGDRRFRPSTEAKVEVVKTYDSTTSRLHLHDEEVSLTSSFLALTSNGDYEFPATSQSFSTNIDQLATDGPLRTDNTIHLSAKSTSVGDTTSTAMTFDKKPDITRAPDVTSASVDVDVLLPGVTDDNPEWSSESAVEGKLKRVGGSTDSFDTTSVSSDSNTWHDDDDNDDDFRHHVPSTTAAAGRTTNRTTSPRRSGTKRCLRMRTGGGDVPDCYRDDDRPSDRRRLEFCDAYSAYVADYDCAPSSSCLEYLCPDVVRLDREAQSMNAQFVDGILNYYDCKSAYSGVWNCSACKVMTSYVQGCRHKGF